MITLNEEARIEKTLKALVDWVDDIVIIDAHSTDRTCTIAHSLGVRVIEHSFEGYGLQKRFAEDQAKHEWVLALDADEVVTQDLRCEIMAIMNNGPTYNAYRLRILNIYPGWDRPRLWAGVDYNNVRFYDRTKVRFSESPVHDSVITNDYVVGQLKGHIHHFSALSFDHIKQKLSQYSDLQAKTLKKNKLLVLLRLPFEYGFVFLKYYLIRCHFTAGLDGIYLSHLAAQARFDRLVKFLKG
jgi:glycosyltransferase involved in cell wall biosynthesis